LLVSLVFVVTECWYVMRLAVVLVVALVLLLRAFYYCTLKVSQVDNAVV